LTYADRATPNRLPDRRAGDPIAARDSYLRAARRTASLPEQRYLTLRAARLHQPAPPTEPAG
jgi:hypothetical protein